MGIILYYMPDSPPCRSVHLLAKELGLDVELRLVNLGENEHLAREYVALNPTHTIPTLDDNGFVIWESHAIMQYLANKYSKDHNLYPEDPEKRAIVDNRMFFESGTLFARIHAYVVPVIRGFADHFSSAQWEKVREALSWLNEFLEKSGGWVAGPQKTIADISMVNNIANVEVSKLKFLEERLVKYEHLSAWMNKCKTAFKYYNDIVEKGALNWEEYFLELSEGKEMNEKYFFNLRKFQKMGITLYYLPHSPPCRAVHLLAKELGLEIEIKTVNLLENEHLNPEFIAVSLHS
ncbi:unnamed protein product [Notodromas monacha]|uniref:Glutathione S-transferase n=1 Tax=Notodromas monacha TaxID=399045 RepID=A0A7R9BMA9_9CRUS|nr:unnamed protein product [Notodromas monacha]CAG0916783.1 unnamed protein product [Notodromas monacha]